MVLTHPHTHTPTQLHQHEKTASGINSDEWSVSGSQLNTATKGLVFLLVFKRQMFTEMYSLDEYMLFQEISQLKKAFFLQLSRAEILENTQG